MWIKRLDSSLPHKPVGVKIHGKTVTTTGYYDPRHPPSRVSLFTLNYFSLPLLCPG